MSEIEQLRKELNELRERVALLEKKQPSHPVQHTPFDGLPPPYWYGPYKVTC